MSEGHSDPELPDEWSLLSLLLASFAASPPVSVNDNGIITGEKFVPIPLRPGRAREPQKVGRRASRLPEAISPDSRSSLRAHGALARRALRDRLGDTSARSTIRATNESSTLSA